MTKNLLIVAAAALLPLSALAATSNSSEKPAMHCDQMKSTGSSEKPVMHCDQMKSTGSSEKPAMHCDQMKSTGSSEKPAMHCDQMKSTESVSAGKCPMHEGHAEHATGSCCAHGAEHATNASAMGFSQEATLHHFAMANDGGSIEVAANDAKDTATVDQVRKHLSMLAKQFAAGDFSAPQSVHGELPPGVTTMQRLRSEIDFHYAETAAGAKVTISTTDPNAIDAVHDFLRYQIREHGTGDAMTVVAK